MEAEEWGGGGRGTYHMNGVKWMRGGHWGARGPHSINIPDFTIKHFIARRDLKHSLDYSTSLVRNLLAGLLYTNC